jgi:hypothetical protein
MDKPKETCISPLRAKLKVKETFEAQIAAEALLTTLPSWRISSVANVPLVAEWRRLQGRVLYA